MPTVQDILWPVLGGLVGTNPYLGSGIRTAFTVQQALEGGKEKKAKAAEEEQRRLAEEEEAARQAEKEAAVYQKVSEILAGLDSSDQRVDMARAMVEGEMPGGLTLAQKLAEPEPPPEPQEPDFRRYGEGYIDVLDPTNVIPGPEEPQKPVAPINLGNGWLYDTVRRTAIPPPKGYRGGGPELSVEDVLKVNKDIASTQKKIGDLDRKNSAIISELQGGARTPGGIGPGPVDEFGNQDIRQRDALMQQLRENSALIESERESLELLKAKKEALLAGGSQAPAGVGSGMEEVWDYDPTTHQVRRAR